MRNTSQILIEIPKRLPDSILLDAWWADLRDEDRTTRETLRLVANEGDRHERDQDQRR
jgi:hypothetical protein